MKAEQEFATHTLDLLEGFGRCEAWRLFGLSADGGRYLKTDEQSRELYVATGGSAFRYYRKVREFRFSRYQAPDESFADSNACRHRARAAFEAALRNLSRRKPSRP